MTTSTKPWSLAPLGMLTIGTGSSSQSSERSEGNFSPDAYIGPTNIGDTAATIRAALLKTRSLRLLAGLYPPFLSSVALPDGCEITAEPGAILQPCVTGAVGLFTGAGSARLSGFRVLTSTYVADQSLMKFSSGKDVQLEDITFEFNTDVLPVIAGGVVTTVGTARGDAAHPMTAIEHVSSLRPRIRGCVFLPADGVRSILITEGAGHLVTDCHFCNDVDAGLGSTQIVAASSSVRLAYRGIQIDGAEWGSVHNCRFWNLGDNNGVQALYGVAGEVLTIAAGNIGHTIARTPIKTGSLVVSLTHAGGTEVLTDNGSGVLTHTSGTVSAITTATINYATGALVINLADNITVAAATYGFWPLVDSCIRVNGTATIATDEQHHSQIALCRIEEVATPGAIRLYGVNSYTVMGTLIGYLQSAPANLGEAGIVIAGKNGDDVVNVSSSVLIFGCDLHNNGKNGTLGCCVYAKQAADVQIKSCRLGVQTCTYQVIFDAGTLQSPIISGTHFEAFTSAAFAIRLFNGAFTKGCAIGGNTYEKYATGLVSDAATGSATTSRVIKSGIQDTSTGDEPTNTATADHLTTNIRMDQA